VIAGVSGADCPEWTCAADLTIAAGGTLFVLARNAGRCFLLIAVRAGKAVP